MYFPYLRGKQFELEALLEVPSTIYRNTIPILEPVNISRPRLYERLKTQGSPLVLITNPYYPTGSALSVPEVQNLVNNQLINYPSLLLGFLIDVRFSIAELNTFLTSNLGIRKVLVFRNNPLQPIITAIQAAITSNPIEYIIFDETKTNAATRGSFIAHPRKVLLTDGFQRQDRNIDYPPVSTYTSLYNSYRADGWTGVGDYLTIGDNFQAGGGPVYVVSLHVTKLSPQGLVVYHFSSTSNQTIRGLAPQKFTEANGALVTSPEITPLVSSGIEYFRDWHSRAHNPQLGAAKKASLIHHIEIMSSLV
jgi:hypothetical protein